MIADMQEASIPSSADTLRTHSRVLVVDDKPDHAELACTWLSELGCEPVAVHTPAQALSLLRLQDFDALFADVFLQGEMDGFELAMQALQTRPGLKIFFASSGAWGVNQRDDPGTVFLHKPYRKSELGETLVRVLAA
jgi:CheY-like chemotaxis protein